MQNSNITPVLQNPLLLDEATLVEIFAEAKRRAYAAAVEYSQKYFGGADGGLCGVAWVEIHGIKDNTKLGRALKKIGIKQDYSRAFSIWNPSGLPVQSVDIKEAGAQAAAEYLCNFGFNAYAGSRLD